MNERNWYAVLTFLAMLGVLVSSSSVNAAMNAKPLSPTVEASLANIAASIQKEPAKDQTTESCQKGRDVRTSDLCAQWYAADAARSSADAAWLFGSLGTFIGIVTMFAAGLAAWYARQAARANRDSVTLAREASASAEEALIVTRQSADAAVQQAKIAQDALMLERRPRLSIASIAMPKIDVLTSDDGTKTAMIALQASLVNFGGSPAKSVGFAMGAYPTNKPLGELGKDDRLAYANFDVIRNGETEKRDLFLLARLSEIFPNESSATFYLYIKVYYNSFSDSESYLIEQVRHVGRLNYKGTMQPFEIRTDKNEYAYGAENAVLHTMSMT